MSRSAHEDAFPLSPRGADVAAAWGAGSYDVLPPFSPAVAWPEYPIRGESLGGAAEPANEAYRLVRLGLRLLGLDSARFGTPEWNPLGHFLKRGETAVLKPNFVRDFREWGAGDGECTITHGAVLRAVLDYAYLAVGPCGRLIIADAPQNDADFAQIRKIAGLDEIQELYRDRLNFEVEVRDLRREQASKIDGVIVGHSALRGDPEGYVAVDLAQQSAFAGLAAALTGRLYGAEYEQGELARHHHDDVHEYLISRTVLDADCVISIPKLKTHKKVGLTVNLKNLVGINGDKNWLPHHREGTPSEGGDQFADDGIAHRVERAVMTEFRRLFPRLGPLKRALAKPLKSIGRRVFGDTNDGTVRSGNWHGNDTAWRMVLDLNRILLYADALGAMHGRPVRRFLSIVDGIVGGEGNGPLDATPKPAGVILAGQNPAAVDLAAARLMGFDWRRVPMLAHALDEHAFPLAAFRYEDVRLRSSGARGVRPLAELRGPLLGFKPHFGWKGHIEISEEVPHDAASALA